MAIRTTWGNPNSSSVDRYVKRTWRLFFVLGKSANSIWQTENHRESQRFNDILIGDFDENYKNIIIKTFMGHLWAFATFSCQYVLKTDDDVYVRVPRLAHWLTKAGQPQRFYGGYLNKGFPVLRDSRSKWFISKQEYNESVYPPYCPGAFHVLSSDILPDLFNYTQYNKPFFIDDAYIGVAASDLGIKAVDIPGFRLRVPMNDADWITATTFGHNLNADTIIRYHQVLTSFSYYNTVFCNYGILCFHNNHNACFWM